jgi:uncharacterized protein YkwD
MRRNTRLATLSVALGLGSSVAWLGFAAGADPNELATAPAWASETRSPRPYARSSDPVWALCPEPDQALTSVARSIAAGVNAATEVAAALHAAGDPHVAARTMLLEGPRLTGSDVAPRVRSWLSAAASTGSLRCGFASAPGKGGWRFAAVALDALADVSPVPTRARIGSWIDIDARLLIAARGAKVVVQTPEGNVYGLPTLFVAGRAKARANVDRAGRWVFQVLVEDATGPRPALEVSVFAGVEPFQPVASASELSTADSVADPEAGILALLNQARREGRLPPLRRDPRLDQLALRHSAAMRGAQRLGHNVGDADPDQRLRAAGYPSRAIGENVAHAASPLLAHRALLGSPSHRANMLDARFDAVGIGVSADADGSVWVTQIFVRAD